jgi:hypothetical protein
MTRAWAVRIDAADAASLGTLRCRSGLEVLERDEAVWLRGPAPEEHLDEELDLALRCLPGAERFSVGDDGQLVPHGRRVPQGRLPEGLWERLSDWLAVALPAAALAGECPAAGMLQIVRATRVLDSNVLMASRSDWLRFGATAAQVRLAPLAFAAGEDGLVVIRGTPLPPIRGTRYVESEGVAVEAGWTWSPPLDAAVLRAALGLADGDLALLHRDGSWDRLRADDFVHASRSAIRLTAGAAHA